MTQVETARPSAEPIASPGFDEYILKIEALSEQNIFACYQCGRCTADCPFSLSPNLVIRLVQLGRPEAARRLISTWECASCYACAAGCPKGVNPARVMKALRSLGDSRPTETLVPATGPMTPPDASAAPHQTSRWKLALIVTSWMLSIRARLMASMDRLFALASAMAFFSNWAAKFPLLRWLGHLFPGIHYRRPLPTFAGEAFPAWFKRHKPASDGHRGTVALFHDTCNDLNYPQTQIAATELLERAGFSVVLADNVCCGRPAISKEVKDKAIKSAAANIPRLFKFASQGIDIVGCEPSCLLTLREEYLRIAPEELREQAKIVASHALLLDEFLIRLKKQGALELVFKAPPENRPVIFHGHCHQKASANAHHSLNLLEGAGYSVLFANAACCGMAGAYGYEKEHYHVSEAAGERALFPLIRSLPEAEVVVMGVSCRQQIEHFTGRPAKHLAEALRDAVAQT